MAAAWTTRMDGGAACMSCRGVIPHHPHVISLFPTSAPHGKISAAVTMFPPARNAATASAFCPLGRNALTAAAAGLVTIAPVHREMNDRNPPGATRRRRSLWPVHGLPERAPQSSRPLAAQRRQQQQQQGVPLQQQQLSQQQAQQLKLQGSESQPHWQQRQPPPQQEQQQPQLKQQQRQLELKRDSPYRTAWEPSETPSTPVNRWTFDNVAESADVEMLKQMEQSRLSRRRAAAAELSTSPAVITQLPFQLDRDTLSNALILVDKPRDWADQEVEETLQWSLKSKSVCSPGKLEHMASGLMVLCLGRATKLSGLFQEQPSTFSGVIKLGEATDTYDASGRVTETLGWEHVTDDDVQAAAKLLRGEIMQVPPRSSSMKSGGRRMVKATQLDPDAELRPQPVYVTAFEAFLREPGSPLVEFSITLGQSGFVRSVAHDLGRSLGSCSHLVQLRRENIGAFSVEDAWNLDVLLPLLKRYRK